MTCFLKLFLQGFSRRILNLCRVPSAVQGWAVRCLYCSITSWQKTLKTRAPLLKMQKSLQSHLSLVRLRDMNGQWRISDEERSKCSSVVVKDISCLYWFVQPACETGNIFSQATQSQLQPQDFIFRPNGPTEHTEARCLGQNLLPWFTYWWNKPSLW